MIQSVERMLFAHVFFILSIGWLRGIYMKAGITVGRGDVRHGRQLITRFCLVASLALASTVALSADEKAMDEHHHHHHHHDHGAAAPGSSPVVRSQVAYELPAVKLVRHDGQSVSLTKELDDGRPVILNFIYTSCTAICPVSSQIMSSVQSQMAKLSLNAHLVSFSIDPEFDTPDRLRKYAKSYDAKSQWHFYTGSAQSSIAVQKAFDAYRGDKMNHLPVTFIRQAPGKPWVRLEGFATPERIVQEYQALVGG
ncbi:SCO family protein [Dechloromonas sp. HYN0024]|nr:SCO family protein [Dechloromonas sp. HYN0024]